MKNSSEIRRIRLFLWIGLAYYLLWVLIDGVNGSASFFTNVINNLWRAFYVLLLNFVLYEYALAYIIRKRRYLIYNILLAIPVLFAVMMLVSYGLYGWRLIGIAINIYTPLREFATTNDGVTYGVPYGFLSIFFFGVIRHLYDHYQLKAAARQLRIEKVEAELNYLRSQTNPHFLFNTLNNIYSLARDKSDLAPESILRLSKILRFMLYETSGDYIAIEQELKIMSDYIALEKLRYDESLRVNFNHDVEDMKQALPPLLLIPLVENAFKHGVSETRNQPFIDIHLLVRNRQLTFHVKNSAEETSEQTKVRENIGLSNLRRQLELLYKDYDLSVKQNGAVFNAILKINLASHV